MELSSEFREGRAIDRLLAWALTRDGVFASADARRFGVSSSALTRAVKRRLVVRILPGVYVVRGCPASWWAKARAAAVWSEGAISHEAAAHAFRLIAKPPELIDVTVRQWRKAPTTFPLRLHSGSLDPAEIVAVDGLPMTSPARTLLEVAGFVEEAVLEEMLECGLRSGIVSMARVRWQLQQKGGRGRTGTAALRRLVESRDPLLAPTESVLETKVARWFRDTRLPCPVRQYRVMDGTRFVGRVDFAYPDSKLAIEAMSYRWHSGRREWLRDYEKDRALRALGWRIRYVIEEDVRAPGGVLEAEIARSLGIALF